MNNKYVLTTENNEIEKFEDWASLSEALSIYSTYEGEIYVFNNDDELIEFFEKLSWASEDKIEEVKDFVNNEKYMLIL